MRRFNQGALIIHFSEAYRLAREGQTGATGALAAANAAGASHRAIAILHHLHEVLVPVVDRAAMPTGP